jgi:hypothetical protein
MTLNRDMGEWEHRDVAGVATAGALPPETA